MVQHKTFKFRLYPTKDQETFLDQNAGAARFVYNKLLEASIKHHEETNKFIFGFDLTNLIIVLKQENPWLKEALSQVLQQSSMNLATALKNRFSKKNKTKSGFPKFKSRKSSTPSFKIPQNFEITNGKIKLPKIGWIDCKNHRKLEGKVKSITISKDVNTWFVSILCEQTDQEITYDPNNAVGIDLGIKTFAVTSDGECINSPSLDLQYKKLKKLQRLHTKKQKGSKNKNKARIKMAKQHRKIRRINKNFIETLSSTITKLYDVVSMEDLAITKMKADRKYAPSIQKLSWGAFKNCVKRKAKHFHLVSRWYPSSKTCSCCGWIDQNQTINDRTFKCECGLVLDRDANAALNIFQEYQRTVATTGLACGEFRLLDSMKQEYEIVGSC